MSTTPAKRPLYLSTFASNIAEVRRLVAIHERLTGKGPGRRVDVETLNKSGIVLLVACWEAFVEDLADAAFEFLLTNASEHSVFPASVLAGASEPLRIDKDARAVWQLAGSGWKSVLASHKSTLYSKLIGKLNTPKPGQVDLLFEKLLGLSPLSGAWHWHGITAEAACKQLEALVVRRGEIAHRVKTSKAVGKREVVKASHFVNRLAVASSNHVRVFIYGRTGQFPWTRFRYGP
jgi:hypothetical protein